MKRKPIIDLIEIGALLVLPMLSSRIGFQYIILILIIMLLSRFLRKEKWSTYGFKAVEGKSLLLAAVTGLALALFTTYIQEPLVSRLTGETADLSTFDNVKGNLRPFLILLATGWIIGGLFEEFLFRGYLLNRIKAMFKTPVAGKWLGILLTSISFAFAHSYQGMGGIINTFLFSIVLGLLLYFFKKNTWYVILVHGFFDTLGIVWLYLGL
ncbi:MAG TPA: CPBP family intramembrane glutamic endopeptidase [Prolixibacteraceae bacterium]|nr:CPBP family intramembrane glutamic endopeptidase [Prolixibacteraceae bacterium]